MTEKAVVFGDNIQLAGIVHEPKLPVSKPAVIFINAGLLHRVGPYRMYVDCARALVDEGYLVFRFDLSGLGDSEERISLQTEEDRYLEDIKLAMDYLASKYNVNEYILGGLCSGADLSLMKAKSDNRVKGVFQYDGCGYRTARYYINYYISRLFNPNWMYWFIQKRFSKFLDFNTYKTNEDRDIYSRDFPPRNKIEKDIQKLLSNEVKLLWIYTGGVDEYYNYKEQFFDMFPKLKVMFGNSVEFLKNADHVYTNRKDREEAISITTKWIKQNFQ